MRVDSLGVIGAGTMGSGIAFVAASAGIPTLLYDITPPLLEAGLNRIKTLLDSGNRDKKYSPQERKELLERIRPVSSCNQMANVDFIVEAAAESLETKRDIFRQLEAVCRTETIFATNTSSLSVASIASALEHPGRFIGMHFFNPAHRMPLVEIVRGTSTDDPTTAATLQLAMKFGKTAVAASDSPGFIVNRIARPFYGEALRILGEGVASVEDIDRIVRLAGGFKMGPFELMDLIGIDINLAVTKSIYEQTFSEPRYRPHLIQQQMVNAGRLGKKSGRGFYTYPGDK